jgi:hypothetical protein
MKKLSESLWADLQDRSSGDIVRKEDAAIVEVIKEFVKRHGFREDEYNINKDLSLDIYRNTIIRKEDLIDGKLPFKFGKVDGTMWLTDKLYLKTLENSPREVTRSFVLYENKLENFIGGPEIVGGNFAANMNLSLKSLDGSPKEVGGNYSIVYCTSLLDIKGISPKIGGNLEVSKDKDIRWGKTFTDEDFRKYSNIKGEIKRI